MKPPPLSLYIHIPWCIKKCPYCDFNSHTTTQIPEQEYIAALLRDLEQETLNLEHKQLASIFFGGGTPSLFSAKGIKKIIEHAAGLLDFDDKMEITLEANPGTFEQDKFNDYVLAGVNRLSIGIQSFNDAHLAKLGRIHDGEQAQNAIKTAQNSGFASINIDLMFGLPGQSPEQAKRDLAMAIETGVPHISRYQLTIEQNTAYYSSAPANLPDDDTLFDMYCQGKALLAKAGFVNYEVSAFAKPGHESRHNLNYWQFGDYIGIGAGAHGKSTNTCNNTITRYRKTRTPNSYMSAFASPANHDHSLCQQGRFNQPIAKNELAFEFMMNALRLHQACRFSLFEQRTGLPRQELSETLATLQADGFITQGKNAFSTTHKGQLFLNDLIARFL
ncbi:MAG: radical SAM family heme chaperone HemW [Pseudomonadales bacterium]|nr:radical SAM family heme chaperone HemW [Pseudomonadales bacterium]